MKVYLDTNIISALAKHDMPELTSRALMKLLDLPNMSTFELVTSDSELRRIGLDRTDAHHLMLAIRAGCQLFLTCDKRTILNRHHEIESRFPTIKLSEPTELLTDLTSGKSPA